jgi:epoxyqueuosine reductase
MPAAAEFALLVKQAALEAGFDLAGVAAARAYPELDHFPDFLASGRSGEMGYLESRTPEGRLKRSAVETAFPWARSVIVCAVNYNAAQPYSTAVSDPGRGWIARYAWTTEDYHRSVLRKLKAVEQQIHARCPECRTLSYVDTGPVVERVYARHAGVGWIGKNTCILHQQLGSWLFLGVIVTSLELEPDLPAPDRCGTCTACIDACPTQALTAPYRMDASRCISYLTIEKRGDIPEELRDGVGRQVFGCDICQDVCPWNREAPASRDPAFEPRPELVNPALSWLAEMDADSFSLTFRGSPVRRARLSGLRRNAIVAMGNSGNAEFLPLLRRLSHDADPVVAEHARWAAEKLEER